MLGLTGGFACNSPRKRETPRPTVAARNSTARSYSYLSYIGQHVGTRKRLALNESRLQNASTIHPIMRAPNRAIGM